MSWLYHIHGLSASQHSVSLLPVAGVSINDIKTCFGGSFGIDYKYTDTTQIGGRLSGEDCKKFGGGKIGKYLVMGFPKKRSQIFPWTQNRGMYAIPRPPLHQLIPFQSMVILHIC